VKGFDPAQEFVISGRISAFSVDLGQAGESKLTAGCAATVAQLYPDP
jgi:hypothetical protein